MGNDDANFTVQNQFSDKLVPGLVYCHVMIDPCLLSMTISGYMRAGSCGMIIRPSQAYEHDLVSSADSSHITVPFPFSSVFLSGAGPR